MFLKSGAGTHCYAPYEQEQEGELSPEADFFSVGMILLKMALPTITNLAMMQIKNGIIPEDI